MLNIPYLKHLQRETEKVEKLQAEATNAMIAAKKMVVLSESREAKTVLAERECTERKLRRDRKCADNRAASQADALLESRANIDRLTVSLKSAHIEHRRDMDALKREHKAEIGRLQTELRSHVENALAHGQSSAEWNIKASEMEDLAGSRLEKMKSLQDEVDGLRDELENHKDEKENLREECERLRSDISDANEVQLVRQRLSPLPFHHNLTSQR